MAQQAPFKLVSIPLFVFDDADIDRLLAKCLDIEATAPELREPMTVLAHELQARGNQVYLIDARNGRIARRTAQLCPHCIGKPQDPKCGYCHGAGVDLDTERSPS